MIKKLALTFVLAICLSFIVIGVRGHNPEYEVVAVYGSTPTIDGSISVGEWDDAASVSFNNTEVFVKQDGVNFYVGFNVSDATLNEEDSVGFGIDVDNDGEVTLQPDDVGLGVYRNGTLLETNVAGGMWAITDVSGWTAMVNSTSEMWQAEFNITYSKINVVAGVEKTIGVFFFRFSGLEGSSPEVFSWPPGYLEIYENPSMWGAITSTEYNWIPEFPSWIILPALLVIGTLTTLLRKRKNVYLQAVVKKD